MGFKVNTNRGKTGPSYIHPNTPQGGNPGGSQPGQSKVMVGVGNQNKGTSGRKTWPGNKRATN